MEAGSDLCGGELDQGIVVRWVRTIGVQDTISIKKIGEASRIRDHHLGMSSLEAREWVARFAFMGCPS